jgi:hypothetical protein
LKLLDASCARAGRLTWFLLILTVGGIAATRGRDAAWPVVGWFMYMRVGDIPATVHTVRVDALTKEGRVVSFFPSDVLTHVERPLVERVMWQAFGSDAAVFESRRFLVRLLSRTDLTGEIVRISGWRVEWDAGESRPLRSINRRRPDRVTRLGSFDANAYL